MRLAWMRPLARRCLAIMQRMWSENTKVACRIGKGLECGLEAGLWMVMFRARLSSSTPVTCMSCTVRRQRRNVRQAQGLIGRGAHVGRQQHFEPAFVLKEANSQRLKGDAGQSRPDG